MIKPVLSIIIVSYNTCELTLNCIKSIYQDKGLSFDLEKTDDKLLTPTEIIVVDNNSQDNSVAKLKNIKNLKLIANKENAGFGKANNQGLEIAQGNYILFLNSDTLILHSAISQSLDWLSSHPEAICCTAQLLNKDKSIQASGGFFPNIFNVKTWCLGLDDLPLVNKFIKPLHPHTPNFYTHDSYYLKDRQQDWITGAFMLIRRSLLNQVRGFDENYFMYGEELELCYRLKQKFPQKQIWYLIGPQIIHLGGASAISKADPIFNEYLGILSFFKKHKTKSEYQIVKLLIRINAVIRSIVYFILGKKDTSKFYLQACSKI